MISQDQPSGRPRRHQVIGTVLMLPIGAIIAFVIIVVFLASSGGYFPGEFLLVFLAIFAVVFLVRLEYRRSRRKYWRQRWSGNEAVRILRERYARGEITADEFREKLRDIKQSRWSERQAKDESSSP